METFLFIDLKFPECRLVSIFSRICWRIELKHSLDNVFCVSCTDFSDHSYELVKKDGILIAPPLAPPAHPPPQAALLHSYLRAPVYYPREDIRGDEHESGEAAGCSGVPRVHWLIQLAQHWKVRISNVICRHLSQENSGYAVGEHWPLCLSRFLGWLDSLGSHSR